MSSQAVQITLARLPGEEGIKAFAYNDATGARVTCQPAGNLSIGEGINLETGLAPEEISWLTANRLGKLETQLEAFAWYQGLDPPRASVFLDVGFNVGLTNLLHFAHCISAAAIKDWQTASEQLMDSDAARQLPGRYQALAQILLNGQ